MARTYAENTENVFDQMQDTATNAKDKISETANKAKDKAEELGRNAQARIDEMRGPAAEKLENTASALHEQANRLPGGERVAGLAHNAADKVRATADYVRNHDTQDLMAGIKAFVRRRPGQALLGAAAVGFLIGRTFRSDD